MDALIARALAIGPTSSRNERTVDITTIGARSGLPRRLEIYFWRVEGRWYLANMPTPRSWYANLLTHPHFVFHLKHDVRADLPATAVPVTDPATRRRVLAAIIEEAQGHGQDLGTTDLEAWVARSPLVEIHFDD
ncbi:nitroreductase/quinone reductase family protein [Streptomyces sp. NBC_01637]|uniref:nitroreductase/quinone reductase family protein n=1 Tax=unclassified Streptomyces TaxID=2593676 RepID=UPI00386E1590|nr:nitroreductase/quinone reductase family protein [Streptomyces sp. NBC_01653]WTD37623.1 nitroreductase/quinone reductase family protein [Streptomyces sp. NBC_01643]WTD93037.1 nitroreductase/quinone reductase family protein [Streptomyces sp. NBC_01637]